MTFMNHQLQSTKGHNYLVDYLENISTFMSHRIRAIKNVNYPEIVQEICDIKHKVVQFLKNYINQRKWKGNYCLGCDSITIKIKK